MSRESVRHHMKGALRRRGGGVDVPDLLARGGESPDYLLEPFARPE